MSEPSTPRSDRIAKRSRYTGESARTVRQQLQADSGLMPVPASHEQLELEAAVLLAWQRAVPQVRAAANLLTLEIDQHSLREFLAASLPMTKSGKFTGIPGLRPRPARAHLDLVLIRPQGRSNAVVRLRGVTKERWREAERHVGQLGTGLWRDGLTELHPDEIAALRNHAPRPIGLMSAVLRRLPVWREANWLKTREHSAALFMYWLGGPEAAHVAQMLEDPLCGIADATVAARQLSGVLRGVALTTAASPGREQLQAMLSVFAPREMSVHWPIPAEVWDEQEMRDALARREISMVYRLLRRYGATQREIAAHTGQSQSEVSEILKGRQVMAFDVLVRIGRGLGVPRGYMGLAYDESTALPPGATADSPRPEEDESAERRRLLAHAAAVTVDTAVFGADSESSVSHPTTDAAATSPAWAEIILAATLTDLRTLAG